MATRYLIILGSCVLGAACDGQQSSSPTTPSISASFTAAHHPERQQYEVTELPGFGGSTSFAESINNRGWVSGWSMLPGDQTTHAFLWIAGQMTDLGTLGGPSSSVGSPVHNENGELEGLANTSQIDPFAENFCAFGNGAISNSYLCQGFVWRNGVMTSLPTLGGNNSYGTGLNNRGEVSGIAETAVQNPNCVAPQVFDFKGVVWGPGRNDIRVLPPFPGDSVSAASGINDRGQVIGSSGNCGPINFPTAIHALLWQDGRVIDMGNLGGAFGNAPLDINNLGEAVGVSDLAGDATAHAFLWRNGHMIDLGTLPGDNLSYGLGINNRGQVVGQSCDPVGNCRAFIWQNGVMTDLNALLSGNSLPYLILAISINDRGEISGAAFDPNTGNVPAYVATPTNAHGAQNVAQRVLLPAGTRELLREQRVFGGFRLRR